MRKEVFSFLLMKMEELDLVERQQEWRTKYVQLTKKGQDLFNEVTPLQERVQAECFSALNKEEKKQLLTLLKKLQQNGSDLLLFSFFLFYAINIRIFIT